MKWFPETLVGRASLYVALLIIGTESAWFAIVRPLFFERDANWHPAYISVLATWVVFILLTSILGVYVIFFWLRRQLRDVTDAARLLSEGRPAPRLAETGPREIRELSSGFNRMAQSLQALESERRFMLASISHDLRTPLTRLRLGIELHEDVADVAAGMINDIEDMDLILGQFLDYVRDGKHEAPEMCDLNQVVAEVCGRYTVNGQRIDLMLGTLPVCRFRPVALRRLVTNLVDNAVRYGRKGIAVRTEDSVNDVVLTVEDRGPGIQDIEPAGLIKPFVRGSQARSGQHGAGLGLSIVDHIVNVHDGSWTLVNRADGGLTVRVTLPSTS